MATWTEPFFAYLEELTSAKMNAQVAQNLIYLKDLALTVNSYTPTYSAATPGATTYAVDGQVGVYAKFGPVVLFSCRVEWTTASGSGEARISLPFAVASVTNQAFSGNITPSGVTFTQGEPVMQISPGVSYFAMRSPGSNIASTVINVEAAGTVVASGWYLTS